MSSKKSEKRKEDVAIIFKEIAKTGKSVKVKSHESVGEPKKLKMIWLN